MNALQSWNLERIRERLLSLGKFSLWLGLALLFKLRLMRSALWIPRTLSRQMTSLLLLVLLLISRVPLSQFLDTRIPFWLFQNRKYSSGQSRVTNKRQQWLQTRKLRLGTAIKSLSNQSQGTSVQKILHLLPWLGTTSSCKLSSVSMFKMSINSMKI
jgi:hypothetical protein